jgi:hypothetical protein
VITVISLFVKSSSLTTKFSKKKKKESKKNPMAITMLIQSMGDNYLPITLTVWEHSMLHQSMGMCVI